MSRDKILKNEFAMCRMYDKLVAKLVKKKQARKMDERDFELLDRKLKNGKTVGQVFENANTTGKCYYYALMLAYGMGGGRLVQGNLNALNFELPNGGSYYVFDHAWLEVDDDLVLDPTSKTIFDKQAFVEAFDVETVEEHPVQEVFSNKTLLSKLTEQATRLHPELDVSIFESPTKSNEKI